MVPSEPDWERLLRLRGLFLGPPDGQPAGGVADYWRDDADLAAYDAVFAERIGWKWDAVLDELEQLGVDPRGGVVADWGCGTGVASRRFVARHGAGRLLLFDRSERAMDWAGRRVAEVHPGLRVERFADHPEVRPDVLLISHVLSELDPRAERDLLDLVARSRLVLWVEPGSRAVSRRLSRIRDRLLGPFRVLAPCTHREPCSALRAGEQHWCHFFARAPATVFQDARWVAIGRRLGIDLRALPYHFLALDSQRAASDRVRAARVVGRPDVGSKLARVWTCDASGLRRVEVHKSRNPELHKSLKKNPERQRWLGTSDLSG